MIKSVILIISITDFLLRIKGDSMILKERIPKDFYKLFRTRNMDSYMTFLVELYEENNRTFGTIGLTIEEAKAVISETIARANIEWQVELDEEMTAGQQMIDFSSAGILKKLTDWGWLKSDYDEKFNQYVISFPEYSQLYVELFKKINSEDDSKERESILSIYSALFTYYSDDEKNNSILKSAVNTSKNLGQLLSNMQDGMRPYFEQLADKKDFLGIQEVLVREINNSDSKKYAILTTTDSFYRYKEAVKELISKIINDNELEKGRVLGLQKELEKGTLPFLRMEKRLEQCEEAGNLVYQVEREFDLIERKYNKLIEQKAVFAKRALARLQYISNEGMRDGDNVIKLINLLDRSKDKDVILEKFSNKLFLSSQYRVLNDNSLYSKRDSLDGGFHPEPVDTENKVSDRDMVDFIPKPLYTQKELNVFKQKNMKDGKFVTTKETVQNIEDLEMLMFVWQQATESQLTDKEIELGEELESECGLRFSKLIMEEKNV